MRFIIHTIYSLLMCVSAHAAAVVDVGDLGFRHISAEELAKNIDRQSASRNIKTRTRLLSCVPGEIKVCMYVYGTIIINIGTQRGTDRSGQVLLICGKDCAPADLLIASVLILRSVEPDRSSADYARWTDRLAGISGEGEVAKTVLGDTLIAATGGKYTGLWVTIRPKAQNDVETP